MSPVAPALPQERSVPQEDGADPRTPAGTPTAIRAAGSTPSTGSAPRRRHRGPGAGDRARAEHRGAARGRGRRAGAARGRRARHRHRSGGRRRACGSAGLRRDDPHRRRDDGPRSRAVAEHAVRQHVAARRCRAGRCRLSARIRAGIRRPGVRHRRHPRARRRDRQAAHLLGAQTPGPARSCARVHREDVRAGRHRRDQGRPWPRRPGGGAFRAARARRAARRRLREPRDRRAHGLRAEPERPLRQHARAGGPCPGLRGAHVPGRADDRRRRDAGSAGPRGERADHRAPCSRGRRADRAATAAGQAVPDVRRRCDDLSQRRRALRVQRSHLQCDRRCGTRALARPGAGAPGARRGDERRARARDPSAVRRRHDAADRRQPARGRRRSLAERCRDFVAAVHGATR